MVELSSLDVRALVLELRALEDAFIDKAYETGREEFALKLRKSQQGSQFLLIRPPDLIARTKELAETPGEPTTFAMLLRKHLVSARVRRIDQHMFDRVVRFRLERGGEPMELVVELFGKGNLILTDAEEKIILSIRTETFASRTIKRGEKLVFPPSRADPATMPRSEFERRAAESEKDLVRFLALDIAIGGDLAEEVTFRSGVAKALRVRDLAPLDLERVWLALRSVLDSPPSPAVIVSPKGIGVASIEYQSPLFRVASRTATPTLSEAIIAAAEQEAGAEPEKDPERERLERQIKHQEKAIGELGIEAQRWEKRGHLVFANYGIVAGALKKAKASVEAQGWSGLEARWKSKEFEAEVWLATVANVEPQRARVTINLDGETVPLDPTTGIEANAALLYDEAKRIRAKLENAKIAVAEARKKLASRIAAPGAASVKPKSKAPTARYWFESHRWFYSTEGFLVVAGRDAAGNEKLVKKHLQPKDRYIHADFHGAPSCIVKTEGRVPGETTMREACQQGVTFSKAFNQFAAADAYWVQPEQVSKTGESGEYVPKGSFVIRGARNYLTKLPLECALGVVTLDKQGRPAKEGPVKRLMSGPPAAVERLASRSVRVTRGTQKPTDAARTLAPAFGVTMDEVVAALPPGNVAIAAMQEAKA